MRSLLWLKNYWPSLSIIEAIEHKVRVVGGDFGQTLWQFGPTPELKGVRNELAAWLLWLDLHGVTRCLSDTVGMLIIGRCEQAQPMHRPNILTTAIVA